MTSQPQSPVGGTATTCLAAGPLEGLCAQAAEVPHEVDAGATVEARARATLVHVCGGQSGAECRAQTLPTPPPQPSRPPCPARTAPVRPAGYAHAAGRCPPGTGRRARTPWRGTETELRCRGQRPVGSGLRWPRGCQWWGGQPGRGPVGEGRFCRRGSWCEGAEPPVRVGVSQCSPPLSALSPRPRMPAP